MTTYLEDLATRVKAMAEACIANTFCAKHPFFWSETTPYWTMEITEFEPGVDYGSENTQRIYTVELRYIVGHLGEGYEGQPIEIIYRDLPVIQDYIEEHPALQSSTYTAPLTGLDPLEVRLLPGPITSIFENSGIRQPQVGVPIRFQVIFNTGITPL